MVWNHSEKVLYSPIVEKPVTGWKKIRNASQVWVDGKCCRKQPVFFMIKPMVSCKMSSVLFLIERKNEQKPPIRSQRKQGPARRLTNSFPRRSRSSKPRPPENDQFLGYVDLQIWEDMEEIEVKLNHPDSTIDFRDFFTSQFYFDASATGMTIQLGSPRHGPMHEKTTMVPLI